MDTNQRKITVAITHYNRSEMILKSFEQVVNDDRISEVVIVDDQSTTEEYVKMCAVAKIHDKVKIFRNEKNLGCYRNKREAISKASNEWVCIWDSDNVFTKAYIDKLYQYGLWDTNTLYAPSQATPFDYRHFEGRILHKINIAKFVQAKAFDTMMNTMNYFVNRDEYLRIWDDKAEPWAIDSIYQNLQWIAAGNRFFVVPGLSYTHTVHKGSLYMEHGYKTHLLHTNIINKFKEMK